MAFSSFNDNLGADPFYHCIGPEKKVFMVHKTLLISQSKYFADQLTAASGDTLHLEEEHPAAFALLAEFLYRGTVADYVEKRVEHLSSKVKPFPKAKETNYSTLVPPFQDGTRFPFTAYIEREPNTATNQHNAFQTICFMQMYQGFSPEELRLSDYIADRKFQWGVSDPSSKHATSSLRANVQYRDIFQPSVLSALHPTTSGGVFGDTAGSTSGILFGDLGYTTASSGMPLPGASATSSGTTGGTLLPPTSNPWFGRPAGLSTSTNPFFGRSSSVFAESIDIQNDPSSSSGLFGRAPGIFAESINTQNDPSSSSGLFGGANSTSITTCTKGVSVAFAHASFPASSSLFPNLNRTTNSTSSISGLFPTLGSAPSTITSTPSSQTAARTVTPDNNLNQPVPTNTDSVASTTTLQTSSVLIKGLPQDAHSSRSLALLHLLLLAEKASWASLFNTAIKPYVFSLGKLTIFQAQSYTIPKSHVELIYSRTKPGSTLRMVAVDCICLNNPETIKEFMDFNHDSREFLADVWGKVMGRQGDGAKEAKPILDSAKEGIYDFRLGQIKPDFSADAFTSLR